MSGGLSNATVADLLAHARELTERAGREADHPALRRALVVLAIAGSGAEGFKDAVAELCAVTRRLGLDPEPLFDAAAALCAEDDVSARETLVLTPRREPPRPPGAGTPYGVIR